MKIVNVMNFVRQIDERFENSTERLFDFTHDQLKLVNEYGVENTFLLQYDVLCDERFVSMFKKEATDHTELGLWYEIVEPLTSACGLPYRSEKGWKYDWHIIPGFSMGYTPRERELLIDEAMRKFKETFGYYPKTVASWLIDTHTVNYLTERYHVDTLAICRDQANTDAYTLLGGYFNQAYYPSKNNVFTPAQSEEIQVNVPVFRLLGPCPIHNFDKYGKIKYASEEMKQREKACFTLEPGWYPGRTPEIVNWFFDTYYGEESLGFAYAQIGQENGFMNFKEQVFSGMRIQIEQLLSRGDVTFTKMRDAGVLFKTKYPKQTPATAVTALKNWDSADVQSVYYDCKNYTANLFRFEDTVFFRSLFLFDERVRDRYMEIPCETFDAVYENLPIIDTLRCSEEDQKQCGLKIFTEGSSFETERLSDGVLRVSFGADFAVFYEDRIVVKANRMLCYGNSLVNSVEKENNALRFQHRGFTYRFAIQNADVTLLDNGNIDIVPNSDTVVLYPLRDGLDDGNII